jgi:hypothetical protein
MGRVATQSPILPLPPPLLPFVRTVLCVPRAIDRQALPGFWRFNLTVPDARCDAPRSSRVEFGCPWFAACAPVESCLGNNTCAEGYTDARCALCADGFYRFNSSCARCPSSPWAVIVGFFLGALAALSISYGLNKSGISLTLIAVGIDYAQVRADVSVWRCRRNHICHACPVYILCRCYRSFHKRTFAGLRL